MYKIRLPNFEGPFDLLLYFIKRDELNIYDIPIAKITKEFLKYVTLMKHFDLELAGEFLVMASTLMYIKTQMLLPQVLTEDGEELEDPRTLLMQRLIEYKQFKEAARDLKSMREDQRYTYYRYLFTGDQKVVDQTNTEHYKNSTLFDLMKAFKAALDRAAETPSEHLVDMYQLTVGEKRTHIIDLLRKKPRIGFFELTNNMQRDHVIVTFLAVLDLIKLNKIIITQSDLFDDIAISARPSFNLN